MADYLSVMEGAVAKLDPNTAESRGRTYDLARRALIDKLQAAEPRLPQAVIDAELGALNDAIGKIEDRIGGVAARPVRMLPLRGAPVGIGVAIVVALGVAAYWLWSGRGGQATAPGSAGPAVGYVYLRQPVYYRTTHPVGTILVDKAQRFLYVVLPNVVALRYGIGVGPECTGAAGLYVISRKEEWPGTTSGGRTGGGRDENPLGPRALYLGSDYRLHGTNAPLNIGKALPIGCFALFNEDVTELYDKAPIETRVVVMD